MQADIKKREQAKNEHKYEKDDLDHAYKFSAELIKETGDFVKGIILFGSNARKKKAAHDIDILVILDDITVYLTQEFVQTYRIIVQNLVAKISTRLHVTTFNYSSFWEYARNGDPLAINILRDGVPIIDKEFFRPLQLLLYQGRIKPSSESVWTYYQRSGKTLQRSRMHMISGVMDLYWAVIDASHAALMKLDEVPPSPNHVADMVKEKMIDTKLIEKKYAKVVKKFYRLSKDIEYKNITKMSGRKYDALYKQAEDYVNRMKKFIEDYN